MIRIDEAIARAKTNGRKIMKMELAAKLWPDSTLGAQKVNMTNLCSNKTARVAPEWIVIICTECGCTADFLLGLSND